MSDTLMTAIDYAVSKKNELIEKHFMKYVTRALITGFYFVMACGTAFMLGEKFLHVEHTGILSKVVYGLFFGMVLNLIIFMNSELFTSNVMYYTSALMRKTASIKQATKLLVVCYVVNFIGIFIVCYLLEKSGSWNKILPDNFEESYLHAATAGKLAKEPMQLFLQGMFANAVVNTAVILAIRVKDAGAKMGLVFLTIFMFIAFGQEHVIANFVIFLIDFLHYGNASEVFTTAAVTNNIVFATLGNIAGGAFIGIVYSYLNNKSDIKYID